MALETFNSHRIFFASYIKWLLGKPLPCTATKNLIVQTGCVLLEGKVYFAIQFNSIVDKLKSESVTILAIELYGVFSGTNKERKTNQITIEYVEY